MLDSRKDNVKIVDFGLSNRWKPQCPLKTLCGSPEYSAPELFVPGTQYGPEVDLWALGVIMYTMAVGDFPFPYPSSLRKEQKTRNNFFKMINNGLSEVHICRVGCYTSDFINLVKGLLNPICTERLKVWEVLKHPWISNKNHWAPVEHEKISEYDVNKIYSRLCSQLAISEETLKAELSNKPFGEIAGYFNIIVYTQNKLKEQRPPCPPLTGITRLSTVCNRKMYKVPQNTTEPKEVLFIGTAQKINEFTRTRKPLRRGIYTCSNPSSPSNASVDVQSAMGDRTPLPRNGPLKVMKNDGSICLTPKNTGSENSKYTNSKLKKNHPELSDTILPTKMKLIPPLGIFRRSK